MKDSIFSDNMHPVEIKRIIQDILTSPDSYTPKDIIDGLLVVSMNNLDFKLANLMCEKFITSRNLDIKNMAIVSASHITRVYKGKINDLIVKELIKESHRDSSLAAEAKFILEDIQHLQNMTKIQKTL